MFKGSLLVERFNLQGGILHRNFEFDCFGLRIGNEIVSYERPRPTSGIHRFVFILFRQQCRQRVYAPGWRQNFNTREFAELYNLGSPVAAVFFNCQRESGSGGRTFR